MDTPTDRTCPNLLIVPAALCWHQRSAAAMASAFQVGSPSGEGAGEWVLSTYRPGCNPSFGPRQALLAQVLAT